jgi:hypothetical protein
MHSSCVMEQSAAPQSTRRETLIGGLRRSVIILVAFSGISVVVGLVLAWLLGRNVGEAIALGFFFVGGLMAIGGVVSSTMGYVPVGFPAAGGFNVREAGYMSPAEHQKTERGALAYALFGLILVVIGVLIDSQFG